MNKTKATALCLALFVIGGCEQKSEPLVLTHKQKASGVARSALKTQAPDQTAKQSPNPDAGLDAVVMVSPPWTVDQVRAAFKPGRSWTLARSQEVWVGPKRQAKAEIIEATVESCSETGFKLREVRRETKAGDPVSERDKAGEFSDILRPYQNLTAASTKITSGVIKCAGREWQCQIYTNSQIVENQHQRLTLWTATNFPGLTLKMQFKSPRLTETIELTNFVESK